MGIALKMSNLSFIICQSAPQFFQGNIEITEPANFVTCRPTFSVYAYQTANNNGKTIART